MIGTFGPAAVRRSSASVVTLVVMLLTAVPTQLIGLLCVAHAVTSLPPMETVMSPMWLRCAVMKASAAAICVVLGYVIPPVVCGRTSGHPTALRTDDVVAPPQPKFTSFRPVWLAT